MSNSTLSAASILFIAGLCSAGELEKIPFLPHTSDVPRRSEGDFVQLRDGRLLFIYTKFTGGRNDAAAAHLASRISADGGRTWTDRDVSVVANEGHENTMSVSLNRLADGRIALFYLRKNSIQDCRPYVRFSTDEAVTWSEPTQIIPDSEIGCYVLNNDRVVQLHSGRLVAPLAQHITPPGGKFEARGVMLCYLSDDGGRTWRRSSGSQDGTQPEGTRVLLQEPGVVERRDGGLLMFVRTNARSQFFSESTDGGETWNRPTHHRLSRLSFPRQSSESRRPATCCAFGTITAICRPDLRWLISVRHYG